MRVLIIDDEGIIVDLYYELLLIIFYKHSIIFNKSEIVLCKDYKDFDALEDKKFDIAIISGQLDHGHTGDEVLKSITCKHIIVIAGNTSLFKDVDNIKLFGKPIHPEILTTVIEEILIEIKSST